MLPNDHFRFALRLASALLIAAIAFILFPAAAHASCTSPANAIEAENCQPGTPQAQWDISGAGDPSIQGFATDISVNAGGTVSFKINTTATQYHLDIYRMGYYQGNGARLIAGKALNNAIAPSVTLPQTQPACVTDTATNLVDCGNWAVSASWAVPSTAVSGIYFAQLVRDDTVGTSHIVFVVRNDSSTSPILFQTSDETWQAYNDYGGHSLYGPTGVFNNSQRAYKVSYNRPFHTRSFDPASWVFYAEYPMVRWLEANGYNVTYFTSLDAARSGSVILNHKLYMTAGHDEYWSGPKRTSIEAARSAGVHLGFFTGTGAFWKTRWENSIDGSNTAYRTLVSYKETLGETKIDPLDPPTWTGTWRDPTFSPPADGGKPENALTGTLFAVNGCGTDNTDLSIQVPAADGKMRFWRNTTIAGQTTGQVFTLPAGTLGYAWDIDADNGFRPAGLFRLSTGTYSLTTDYLIDYGETYAAGTATHHSTLYKASSKSLVFGAGTVQWAWGLDNHHDTYCGSGPYVTDANMQQATVNLLADMGIQPATLQAGLLTASASADTTPPSSTITSPASGAKVEPGATVTIHGTAADTGGGVVGGVEVSTDGGTTWHPATGRESWSYAWTVTGTGSITLRSRAVDDSGNLETPAAGVTVNISAPSCPCTIWPSTTTPGTLDSADPNPYELGVKFTADFDGTITGIRFYKSAANIGTHVGNLWSAAGSLLGSGTFTTESASGWQEMDFTTPVAITANTVYVVSYSTTTGHYSFDSNYFTTTGVDNPPLHALQNGVSGGDGVLATTPGVFPSSTFSSANYWVDVVYMPTSTKTLVSIAVAPVNPTLPIGHTQSFTATGTYSDGSKTDITSQVSWSSSNTNVATVSAGVATGVAGGAANITATLGLTSGYSTVTVQSTTLAITTTALPSGAVNVPYSATLGATGGVQPYTWSLAAGSSLPAGLTLSASGQITGTPLIAATSTFTVQVKDAGVQEGNVNPQQTASQAVSITITIPAFFTIWPSTAAPVTADAGDISAVELGVSFRADTGGIITGIRFYKSAANTGTHVGNLWTSTGTLLATATFSNETASGWQQVSFATPVAITANTVYVASYHTTVGHYAADANTFTTAGVDNPPLHAVQNTATTPNGVFTYDITTGCNVSVAPCFPATSYNSANYWVDVVFQNTFGISGTISGAGGNGATVTASVGGVTVATVTANALGVYNLTGLGDGTYTVVPTNAGYTFSPASQTVTVTNGNATANFTTLYSISGTIAGIGGNGASVTLSGAASATVTADATGHYAFIGLAPGVYTVTPTQTGYTFYPPNRVDTINDGNVTANFSTTFHLAGAIAPGPAGSGAAVTVTGPMTATWNADNNGNYGFTGLPVGTYTVTPSKPGFIFSPASQTVTSNGNTVTGINFTAAVSITMDAMATADSSAASTSISSSTFSTKAVNELLLAFVATHGTSASVTVSGVTGVGLTWVLVERTNAQRGTAEIWRAFAPSTLSNASVTATLSRSVAASITVISFAGVNTSGTNGSGAIGANGTGSATSGAPTASLVTTQNNSWVLGVGNDVTSATARTLGAGQTMIHQYLAGSADTFWVQAQSSATPLKGTSVTINDTAPTSDRYNLSICEILPGPSPWVLSGTITGGGVGATVTLSGAASASVTADASGNYSFTGLNNGSYTVTPSNVGFGYTPPSQAVTISNANLSGVNFTGVQTYSISGSISPSSMGAGATITLTGAATATATADASGNYAFTGLLNGAYTLTPSKTGFTFTPASQAATISSASLTGVNFSAVTYAVSGTISGPGGSGATVSVASSLYANMLLYSQFDSSHLPGSGPWGYVCDHGTFTANTTDVTDPWGGSTALKMVGASTTGACTAGVTYSGIFQTAAGVTSGGTYTASVWARGAAGGEILTITMNSKQPCVGSPWTLTTSWQRYSCTVTGYTGTGINYMIYLYQQPGATIYLDGAQLEPNSSVGTYAQTTSAQATTNVPVSTATADASGNYAISGLANGSYTVTPSNPSSVFTPPNQSVTVASASIGGVNFSSTVTYSVSGTISGLGGNGAAVYLSGTAMANSASNMLLYSQFDSSHLPGSGPWGYVCDHGTFTANTTDVTDPWGGSTALKMVGASTTGACTAGVTYSGIFQTAAGVTSGGTYTASVWARGAAGGEILTITMNSKQPCVGSPWTLTTSWQRYSCTVTGYTGTGINYMIYLYQQPGATIYLDGAQLEPRATVGTYVLTGNAPASMVTADVSGNYSFSGLNNGAYTVTPSKTGFSYTPASQPATINNANVTALNFGTVTYSIAGTISGAGGNGATVNLSGTSSATITADASGNYTFSGLVNGPYTITPSSPGFTFSPPTQPVSLNGASLTGVNFTTLYSISGTIGGPGESGATVSLSGAATATVAADASGNYSFTGLNNGAYTVTPSKAGMTYSPASQPATVSNANVTALNFSTVTYSIAGTISGTGGNAATVKLTGVATATVTADASGNFTFTGLVNGPYTITPSNGAYTFNPPNQAVTINSANITGVTFASVAPTTFSISGTISNIGGNGATVTLSGTSSATTTADASGNFTFSGLANGSYTVTPSKTGYIFTPANKAVTVSGANVTGVTFTSTAQLAIDKTVSTDRSTSSTSLVSPAVTTSSTNELLLAFVSTDATGSGITVTAMSGGGLTWTLVKRTNTQLGTSEIWRAFSATTVSNATVTATLSQSVAASITVVTFTGVDTTGTGGSGAIGATGTGNSAKGAPTASLTTTRNNSWEIGVGNDYDTATSRTVPSGQTVVHQYLATTGDTFWVQRQTSTTPTSGTAVTINDTAPNGDRYNLSICEVLPAQ